MFGFVFNTRRALFQDKAVREALALMFDFEWTNRNLYAGRYQRLGSYWQGSELSALGKPADATERTLLAPYPDAVLPEVMDGTYEPARTDGTGRDRKEMKRAYDILVSQGYKIENEQMLDLHGTPLSFEILTRSVGEERLGLAYKRTLERLGIGATIRTVDDAQYQKRLQTFDYDVILGAYSNSLSPGYEQFSRWGSQSKEVERQFQLCGGSRSRHRRITGQDARRPRRRGIYQRCACPRQSPDLRPLYGSDLLPARTMGCPLGTSATSGQDVHGR